MSEAQSCKNDVGQATLPTYLDKGDLSGQRATGENFASHGTFARALARGRRRSSDTIDSGARAPASDEAAQEALVSFAAREASLRQGAGATPGTDGPRHSSPRISPAAALASPRVLTGTGDNAGKIRIHVESGALAGSEIHLALGGPGAIEARLLTLTEASRQTLVAAMERVRLRLHQRGWTVVAGSPASHDGPLWPAGRSSHRVFSP